MHPNKNILVNKTTLLRIGLKEWQKDKVEEIVSNCINGILAT